MQHLQKKITEPLKPKTYLPTYLTVVTVVKMVKVVTAVTVVTVVTEVTVVRSKKNHTMFPQKKLCNLSKKT